MALADHLRELRNRITISAAAILIAGIVGWVNYDKVIGALTKPLKDLQAVRDGVVNINFAGMTDAFSLQLTVSLFVGLILASPVWLFQIWRFIVPGLTKRERTVARLFIVAAVPLFVAGCGFAFVMVPKAVTVLLSFTPPGAYNLQDGSQYLNFVLKFILAFGCAFLLPVFLVALNLVGVIPAQAMLKGWRPAVMIIFVFAAVMTPTPDAYTMLFLATPMIALYFASVGLAFLFDRRKQEHQPDWLDIPDDRPSSL
ncbi:preprotein translocase subunit TatC [Intrasporangium oryzae NRRL B-24470]|uniref:Sec-independent protein translocase protein TatC n=2 Tax=Intrasporangium TaxID=53357 RepID=W9GAH4_9MICO|nr:preprotein translocase subunit TatC [Intrasporangium oryzae NRRL B-24470]